MPTGARGVEKGESDMHLYGTKRDRSECVVCCFPLYKLKKIKKYDTGKKSTAEL